MTIKQINKKQLTSAPPVGRGRLRIITQQQKQQCLPAHLFLHKGERLPSNPAGPQELQVWGTGPPCETVRFLPRFPPQRSRCPLPPQKVEAEVASGGHRSGDL